MRPTPALRAAQALARPAAVAMSPAELGSARLTRHSFARSFLRTAARERWQVTRELFAMDELGRGDAVYRVEAGGRTFRLVAFSTCIDEAQRTDRVVAETWDLTAALVEGDLPPERHERLRREVPRQEDGRADAGTIIWGRANRSARFFDYVVGRLAQGLQPERDVVGDAAYVMRSTAFYANGKWGLTDYDALSDSGHPLAVPYRAQMLTAWLFRELSYDLVEHCAAVRSAAAVRLTDGWDRFLGLGNATGLGMVPYVINHPRILDAWVALRELPLAHALAQPVRPGSQLSARVLQLLRRAVQYFAEKDTLSTSPYVALPHLSAQLATLLPLAADFDAEGDLPPGAASLQEALRLAAGQLSLEARQVVDTVLVECFPELDPDVEALLRVDESVDPTLAQSVGTLLDRLERDYGWALELDFDDPRSTEYFWFYSANNQEPRRGRRGTDPGEDVEFPLGIARDVHALAGDLRRCAREWTLAEFLLAHPWHRGALDRVQGLSDVVYGEARVNPLAADFLPLDLQRFQLAVYGMENFSPMSTDWLRVTLFAGAPRASDICAGVDDDWLFSPKPAAPARQGAAA